jgi:hypothetical protein
MSDVFEQVKGVLSSTPDRWNNLVGSIPDELLKRAPGPKEWSALECLQHLIDTEHIFPFRVRAFLAGQDFPAFDPDTQGTKPGVTSATKMVAEFAHLRAESLSLLTTLRPADLGRRARHAELGPVSLDEMLHEWAAHDLMHTVQAERALMQPFIARSGPWRSYFADHDVELPRKR